MPLSTGIYIAAEDLEKIRQQMAKLKLAGYPVTFNKENANMEQRSMIQEMFNMIFAAVEKCGYDPKKFVIYQDTGEIIDVSQVKGYGENTHK